jgi:hypothetical protein
MKRYFRPLFLLIITFFFVSSSVVAQTDLYKTLETPFYDPNSATATNTGSCSTSTTLVGSDNIQKALNFLMADKGLTLNQAAAVIGNFEQESGQGLNPLDQQFGSPSTVPIPGEGFGIAQWTDAGRQQGLVTLAQQENSVPGDLAVQLDYFWQELTTNYTGTYSQLKGEIDVVQATQDFELGYEGAGTPIMQNRINYAKEVVNNYNGSPTGSGSGGSCTSGDTVNCANPTATSTGLSQTRQNVICLAQAELSLWKSQSGYPQPAYAATGLLKYTDGWYEEWCADFVSWLYNQANYPFSGGSSGGWRLAGVASIQALGEQNGNFHWHSADSGYIPSPGDLAIHSSNHVNIFISSSGGISTYIGGDQGNPPYGAPLPTQTPPSPPSGSNVSTDIESGYYGGGITGYVSPN